MVGENLKAKMQLLFPALHFICGGHGARRPAHGTFTVPKGVTINFYVADGDSLPNDVGQKVDQIAAGGTGPTPVEVIKSGTICHNYHLYSSKAGGYLNLGMSSAASSRYITTTDKDNGIALHDIIKSIVKKAPNAVVHWSACRSLEADGDVFGWSKPTYSSKLASLGDAKSKLTSLGAKP